MLHSSLDDLALKFGIKQRIYGSFVLKDVVKLVLLHLNQLGDYDRDVWYFVEYNDLLKGKKFYQRYLITILHRKSVLVKVVQLASFFFILSRQQQCLAFNGSLTGREVQTLFDQFLADSQKCTSDSKHISTFPLNPH